MKLSRSERLFEKAKQGIPGGVNSPVRAFRSVGGTPRFIASARGAYLRDVDQNHYIDYVGSWGPMILGHTHPKVLEAIQETAALGFSFGAPSPLEVQMAEKILQFFPNLEQVRMVNSGTEAVMSAVRLARAYTGRDKILKFEGCYHGHSDDLLVDAGSGAMTHGHPSSAGVPKEFTQHTLVAAYNDLKAVQALVAKHGKNLAAILVEPIAGNMGVVLPAAGFLKGLKKLCRDSGALLIFDEVMTGFRVHRGGAQGLYQVKPDLTTLGKVIGGGLPVGAYGGARKIMKLLSPEGPAYQAGTLSGNPIAMAAGLATLKLLQSPKVYQRLMLKTGRLAEGLQEAGNRSGLHLKIAHTCGMLSLFFTPNKVANLQDVKNSRTDLFQKFFHAMLERGVYLPPSPYEAWFVSLAHGENEIAKTLRAAKDSFMQLKELA